MHECIHIYIYIYIYIYSSDSESLILPRGRWAGQGGRVKNPSFESQAGENPGLKSQLCGHS